MIGLSDLSASNWEKRANEKLRLSPSLLSLALSSSGLGHQILILVTRVQIPMGPENILKKSKFLGMLLLMAAIYMPFFQTLLKTVPLGLFEWSVLLIFGSLNLVLIEISKWYFINRKQYS